MRELVFDPPGMKPTCHVSGQLVLENRAQCYQRLPAGMQNAPLSGLSFLVGGGSLYSTADDLVRFGIAWSRRKGMPGGTWRVFGEGLGWARSKTVRWNGKTSQFGAFLDLHVEDDVVVAFAGNIGVAGGALLRDAVPKIVAG
ncbi:MAG: beta-lactamase family protein [bacterium]|nr:beta-lactamase family protein [bacterium]